ncbi:DNA replication/repair protein RecF [Bifidobacterium eulemuris]|uniref:DNA replication and repair protein RecF n=1 Tax=Bifidobacterium eulemuris TaxID=1765219 RepID=A0A261G1Y0_9BIFI|nr:DNA replication/repair protein RecF [Bifidobacterium eulemuris]OZG65245.1 DNA recombination protein RecF [Bifidobacterium eulemuris]QOL32335.1 DNA replication/repair protein RecF [Bifidobacterium eulemuris]
MHVSRLALDRFRSWHQCVLDLNPGVNVLQGRNGLGKTNIVEAVEVLSTGGSHRASSSLPLIERGQTSAVIRANVEDGDRTTTYEVTIASRGANRGRVNGGASVYMRDIVGRVPCVTFTPEDQRMVAGDPATRRGFLDQAGVLLTPGYAALTQNFAKIGRQRAALLKQLGDRGANGASGAVASMNDAVLSGLEIWTGQFIEAGVELTKRRHAVVEQLAEPFARIYAELAGETEQVELRYAPSFDEVMAFDDPAPHISQHFQRIYPGEVARGVNLIGPQRDDLALELNGMAAREYASNGEMWTMALALKMALFETVARVTDVTPIVILDDVFAQLDEHRRNQIMAFAAGQPQVLITVAAASDMPELPGAKVIDVASLVGGDADETAVVEDPGRVADDADARAREVRSAEAGIERTVDGQAAR